MKRIIKAKKNNAEYWDKRFVEVEKITIKTEIEYFKELEKQYAEISKEIEKELNYWYNRFAKNNELSFSDAKKTLEKNELKEFKLNLNEYIKKGKKNGITKEFEKELEKASTRVHIDRLYSIQLQLTNQIETLYSNKENDVFELIKGSFLERYNRTVYEIQKGTGIGFTFNSYDNNKLDKLLIKPWTVDRKTFSDRIWINRSELIDKVQKELQIGLTTGRSINKMSKNISFLVKGDGKNKGDLQKAKTLIRTELAFFSSDAQEKCFKDLGVEKYEIVVTLDTKTSKICQYISNNPVIYNMSDYKIGVTAPPFHPNCRTTTAPWFNDIWVTRVARNNNNKIYEVPSNITYFEWEQKYLK